MKASERALLAVWVVIVTGLVSCAGCATKPTLIVRSQPKPASHPFNSQGIRRIVVLDFAVPTADPERSGAFSTFAQQKTESPEHTLAAEKLTSKLRTQLGLAGYSVVSTTELGALARKFGVVDFEPKMLLVPEKAIVACKATGIDAFFEGDILSFYRREHSWWMEIAVKIVAPAGGNAPWVAKYTAEVWGKDPQDPKATEFMLDAMVARIVEDVSSADL